MCSLVHIHKLTNLDKLESLGSLVLKCEQISQQENQAHARQAETS
jgi:hypothetical protein